ncbi:hypothetical protein Acsp06_21020 [Actinomycetospora sp. NBRC 106375]|uniref:PE domain-containing protein n=1 Tax=Actinomycetospora sp. NBRC 106375 TaxID=3032207 RepID=UPI0024A4C6BB|nr:PE domain-containing protein [Actinomycetospora sp. NBRC 106375]GLZ45917.1 hypothetical protein Acsp06_21020 [Actinomycetospora sp. NBRC 106375]
MTEPGGLGDKGSFSVDISQAPGAIRELEQARAELESIRDEAQLLGQVNAGARDEVSLDAARALGQTAVGGPHAFMDALNSGIDEVDRMLEALRASFDLYESGDDAGRESFHQSQ